MSGGLDSDHAPIRGAGQCKDFAPTEAVAIGRLIEQRAREDGGGSVTGPHHGARPGRAPQHRGEAPRPYSALKIRAWVEADEYVDAEALHRELTRRVDFITHRTLSTLGEKLAPPTEYPSDQTPLTRALYGVHSSRLTTPEAWRLGVGCAIVAHYWADRDYEGRALPRIVWSVDVWDLAWPARIHVLDLDRLLLGEAYERSPLIADLRRGGRPVRRFADLTMAELEQEEKEAVVLVELDPVAANLSPYTCGLRAELIRRSQDGELEHNEQKRAHVALVDLDQAGYVDFTRERGWSASQLRRLLAYYEALHPPLSRRRAHKVMAREWRRSPKRIEALVGAARLYERIQGVWEDYREEEYAGRPNAPTRPDPVPLRVATRS